MKTVVERKLHLEHTLRSVGEATKDAWEAYNAQAGNLSIMTHLDDARKGLMAAIDIMEDAIVGQNERSVLDGDQ